MENKILFLQKKVGAIAREETNPFYNSKYFDINKLIEVLKPVLQELELTLTQPIIAKDDKNVLCTFLNDGKGNILESSMILPDIQDPQKLGSAITYYRRYAIQSMLLLQAEDDDSNLASGAEPKIYNKGFAEHKANQANQSNRFNR